MVTGQWWVGAAALGARPHGEKSLLHHAEYSLGPQRHPGGQSILKNLMWLRADVGNTYLGGGAEAKLWEKVRADPCPQT